MSTEKMIEKAVAFVNSEMDKYAKDDSAIRIRTVYDEDSYLLQVVCRRISDPDDERERAVPRKPFDIDLKLDRNGLPLDDVNSLSLSRSGNTWEEKVRAELEYLLGMYLS